MSDAAAAVAAALNCKAAECTGDKCCLTTQYTKLDASPTDAQKKAREAVTGFKDGYTTPISVCSPKSLADKETKEAVYGSTVKTMCAGAATLVGAMTAVASAVMASTF